LPRNYLADSFDVAPFDKTFLLSSYSSLPLQLSLACDLSSSVYFYVMCLVAMHGPRVAFVVFLQVL
jgi:hypothetical protein